MHLSRSSSALTRHAWLWGTLVGAALLPVLMAACSYGLLTYLPAPKGFPAFHLTFSSILSIMLRRYAICGGGLGCCGAMLWMGSRSLLWRSVGVCVAAATVGYLSWEFWRYWLLITTGFAEWNRWNRSIIAATYAPLFLAALLLLFFALLTRPAPKSIPQSASTG